MLSGNIQSYLKSSGPFLENASRFLKKLRSFSQNDMLNDMR